MFEAPDHLPESPPFPYRKGYRPAAAQSLHKASTFRSFPAPVSASPWLRTECTTHNRCRSKTPLPFPSGHPKERFFPANPVVTVSKALRNPWLNPRKDIRFLTDLKDMPQCLYQIRCPLLLEKAAAIPFLNPWYSPWSFPLKFPLP